MTSRLWTQRDRRRQDELLSNVYKYFRAFDDLPDGMNHLVAVVVFRARTDETGQEHPNNFIVTTYFQTFEA